MRGRSATVVCWAAVAPVIVWAGVRLAGWERGPAVQLLAFTPYVAGLSLVPVVLALALRRWVAAAVAVLTTLVLVAVVAPRAVADDTPTGGPTLRVMTVNTLGGQAHPGDIVRLVRDLRVDVLSVQELYPGVVAGLSTAGIDGELPYHQVYGSEAGVFSRLPLENTGVHRNPAGFLQGYGTVLAPGAPPVLFEAVHSCSPYSLRQTSCWRRDLSAQPKATPDGPLRILAGDFNATLDHALLRQLLATGYVDAADRAGEGLVGTWGPYDGDRIPPVVIDHVLVDRRIGVRGVSVHAVAGSDHRAVVAELSLPAA
jgi:endonuclease/exonuclease/phosphatase (EEP) superfamily protein YafD